MMAGAFYSSLRPDSGPTFDVLDRFTSPIYMMFFVLSGASLDLSIFFNENGLFVLLIAGIYIVSRVVGKWAGAFSGATITRCSPEIRKYLGFTLAPQAGVAIGLATTASALFTELGRNLGEVEGATATKAGALILAVILTSTLVYELFGPLVSKFALTKAGAIAVETKA